jgi:hypothetical protein
MAPHPTLHAGFERLIGAASVDTAFSTALLTNPRATALKFGIAAHEADMVADIQARDLRAFATALLPRLYGKGNSHGSYRSAVTG